MKGFYISYLDKFPKEDVHKELFLYKEHTITDIKNILEKTYSDVRRYNTDDNFLELFAINSDCEFSFNVAKKKD